MTLMQRFEGVRPVLCPAEAWFLIGQPAVNRTDLPRAGSHMSIFGHLSIQPPPQSSLSMASIVSCKGLGVMETPQDHWKHAEECVAMARLARADGDRALWLTLAQSWARLAEQFASAEMDAAEAEDHSAIVA